MFPPPRRYVRLAQLPLALTMTATLLLPVPHPPLTRVSDLSFVDALHGWALGISCPATGTSCTLALRATGDGGRTWRAVTAPPTAPAYTGDAGNTFHVGYIRFADVRDGWAFGPGLYVTRDGGRTWTPDRRIGAVVALAPRGRSVWAISSTCPALSGTPSVRCRLTLFVSNDLGHTWRQEPIGASLHDSQAQIIRADAASGWIRAWSGDASAQNTTLMGTHDGGATWHILADPCAPLGFNRYDRLAARSTRELWALCGSEPSAGAEGKMLYVSLDGGRHWRLVAATCAFAMRCPAHSHALPIGGYVDDLAVTSVGAAWTALQRGTLYGTRDGGHTWQPSTDVEHETLPGEGVGPLDFVDTARGWLAAVNKIVRTVDGGKHWTATTLT